MTIFLNILLITLAVIALASIPAAFILGIFQAKDEADYIEFRKAMAKRFSTKK